MPRVVLFGATGYTGRLTAAEMASRGLDFAIAGRNKAKLEALAEATGNPPIHVADVDDVDALVAALEGARMLITCVGPFTELGDTAVEAALRAKVNYADSTGEGVFINRLIERSEEAKAAGVAMAPAMGFDDVPADLAATLAVKDLSDAELVLTYSLPTQGSTGTIRSALGIVNAPGAWVQNGRKIEIHAGQRQRWAPMPPPLGPRSSVAFPLAEGFLAPLHLDLRTLELYVTMGRGQEVAVRFGLPLLRPLFGADAVRNGLEWLLDRALSPSEGPDAATRAKGLFTILAEATGSGTWRNVALAGADPYGLTAKLLALAGGVMSADDYNVTGVVAPVEAIGESAIREELEGNGVTIDTFEPSRKGA